MVQVKSALLALGGNLDHENVRPIDTLRAAIADIEFSGFKITNTSRFYQTPAFPIGSGPDYINAAIAVEAADLMMPNEFFSPLAKIELAHGRLRQTRWGGRSLDIDILAFDELIMPDIQTFSHWAALSPQLQLQRTPDQLIVPHPRMHQRAFVLAPLLDIAPDWHHPVFALSVRDMYNALPAEDRRGVIALPL
jgi:2-amino-4-hydroxy-6-hydroxymethyldihydropteridine diphosphokinase